MNSKTTQKKTRAMSQEHYDKYVAVWAKASEHTRHELSKQFYPRYKGKSTHQLYIEDNNLNNIPLKEFNGYFWIMQHLIIKKPMSMSQNTCYLKGLIVFRLLEDNKIITPAKPVKVTKHKRGHSIVIQHRRTKPRRK